MLIQLDKNGIRMQQEIIKALSLEEFLSQCCEECNELAISCNKVRRAICGTTPVTLKDAYAMLTEETGDVMLLLDILIREGVLDLDAAIESAKVKNARWYGRVTEK